MYQSTIEGKKKFVEEKVKPLVLAMDDRFVNVEYITDGESEFVVVTNKNPDKTAQIDVTADSLTALVADVFEGYWY